jgi:hypothetical protein
VDAAQLEYAPTLTWKPGDQCLNTLQFLASRNDSFSRRCVIDDDHRCDIGHRVDAHNARASNLLQGNIACGTEQIGAAVLDVAHAIKRHDARVRFLHDIVNVDESRHHAP